MRRHRGWIAGLGAFGLLCASASVSWAADTAVGVAPMASSTLRSGLYLDGFDRSVRPQDDLYRFAGGTWLAKTEIPADRSNYGTFSKLEDDAIAALRALAEAAAADTQKAPGSDRQKLGDLYAAYMDEQGIEQRGLAPLKEELARIDSISDARAVFEHIGRAQRLGGGAPIGFYVGQDRKNSSRYIAGIGQSGLTMPDREYYLADDDRNRKFREAFVRYAEQLLTLSGTPDAATKAARVLAVETSLAQQHWTRVENRDPVKTYNKTSVKELASLAPAFDWSAFVAGLGVDPAKIQAVDVRQPSYLREASRIVRETSVDDWRAYFRFRLLDGSAAFLPAAFDAARFDFRERTLRGVQEQQPRWRRGVNLLDRTVGEIAGRAYVEENFRPEARERIRQLVANLRQAFDAKIDELEWMSAETKLEAKRKLARFTVKVGYPDQWRDYATLEIQAGDLIGNLRRVNEFEFARQISRLDREVDRNEWFMTPQTVNAYYSPPMNEIVFPAAILQPPFFDPLADDAVNYGGIGGVIGHEFSHGFDDSGRRYDGEGNLRDWWTFDDNVRFRERAGRLAAQYSQYKPVADRSINGDLTLGENIGDLSGLAVAYRAYMISLGGKEAPVIDGFTGPQRFFLGWAQVWRRKYREDELRTRLITDSHSPSEYRCNGVVTNMAEFYEAFGVKPGDRLYREPAERVKIW
ncbi:MAG: M13 family metallopeptidase [Steroidobacteraceae bacterium]